jgi:cytochrome c553
MSIVRSSKPRGVLQNAVKYVGVACVLSVFSAAISLAQGVDDEPSWAYSIGTPAIHGDTVFSLPDAERSFTFDEIRRVFGPADWYPGDHPTMPDIVANGRFPRVWACALCHYPNGQGRPENAGISGLPRDYFVQQLYDFRNGLRASAQPRKFNTSTMVTMAQGMTDEEILAAADYYSSMPWRPWTRVVETDEVPKTRIVLGMYVPLEGEQAGTEPLGLRIIEVPEEPHRTETLRDPRTGFIAYVPSGAVERGEELATTGAAGKTTQCSICHGEDLNGIGLIPGLAGRSPSYFVRQMYDMREGSRNGVATALMKPVVANLTVADMIDLAAYVASIPPPEAAAEN